MNEQKISWKRSDLKWRGKQAFKKKLLVSSTGKSGAGYCDGNRRKRCGHRQCRKCGKSGLRCYNVSSGYGYQWCYLLCQSCISFPTGSAFALLSASAMVTVALIGVLFHFFVGNVLEVGGRDFYIENLYSVPGPGKLLSVFRSGNYGNIVKTMFLRDLYLVLWTLLFIIPGVVKSYEYKMIPYLLAEYPDMSTKEVFAKSREMMNGQKMDTFILDLSFIPWSVLSAITAGIAGLFYVSPYKDATYAELYDTLAAGMPGNGQQVYEDESSGIY